jgi:hypothetical protein
MTKSGQWLAALSILAALQMVLSRLLFYMSSLCRTNRETPKPDL